MATPKIDEVFNDLVAINQIAINSLQKLGKVRVKSMTEEDLRKLVLSTSKSVIARFPCLRLGDDAIEEMNSKYSHLLAGKMEVA